jgi:hypothetical protein
MLNWYSIIMPSGSWASLWPAFAALHGLALALLVAVALAWGRHGRRRLLVASGFLTVSALTLIYVVTIHPSDIPVDWITILHEGLEQQSIWHLYTHGVHAGANFAFAVSAAAAGHAPNLHVVVWLNLLLALVNVAIFLHLAVHIAGPVWALPWTLIFALNPAMFQASFSELPTNLLALYFLAGAIAWAVLYDPLPQPRTIRRAAYGLCAVLTVFVTLTRPEVGLIGAVALGVHAGHALLGGDRWSAAGRRLRQACQRPLVFLAAHPAAVAVLSFVGLLLAQTGLPWGLAGRSECAGLYPFNASIFSLFVFLPMLLLPIGVSIATLFGCIHAIVHFRRFGGLALSLLVLARMCFAAQGQYYESLRYFSCILPAIFLLALFGKEEFDKQASRWRPNWYRAARIGYVMAWFILPLPGTLEFFLRPEYHRDAGFSQLLLDRNTQREVRHLVALTEKNPQCVFVGRVIGNNAHRELPVEWFYGIFGASVADPIFVSEKEAPLGDVIARYVAGASCVRLYYGGDCNLKDGDRCTQFIAGRRRIDEERFWSRPYNNPLSKGYGAPEIVLATYAWP